MSRVSNHSYCIMMAHKSQEGDCIELEWIVKQLNLQGGGKSDPTLPFRSLGNPIYLISRVAVQLGLMTYSKMLPVRIETVYVPGVE